MGMMPAGEAIDMIGRLGQSRAERIDQACKTLEHCFIFGIRRRQPLAPDHRHPRWPPWDSTNEIPFGGEVAGDLPLGFQAQGDQLLGSMRAGEDDLRGKEFKFIGRRR